MFGLCGCFPYNFLSSKITGNKLDYTENTVSPISLLVFFLYMRANYSLRGHFNQYLFWMYACCFSYGVFMVSEMKFYSRNKNHLCKFPTFSAEIWYFNINFFFLNFYVQILAFFIKNIEVDDILNEFLILFPFANDHTSKLDLKCHQLQWYLYSSDKILSRRTEMRSIFFCDFIFNLKKQQRFSSILLLFALFGASSWHSHFGRRINVYKKESNSMYAYI